MAELVTLPRAPDSRMSSPMNRRGGGGDASPSLIAELDADVGGPPAPRTLVFNSGLGGLSVLAEIRRLRPDLEIVYAADDAAFPYGRISEAALVARVQTVMARLIGETEPTFFIIACSTASTLALPPLRAAYPRLPFVGTVPAIKPAATASRSGLISVLATRGTVARDYTHALVRDYAANCEVTLVGSALLAVIAERIMRGEAVEETEITREIAPCFVERELAHGSNRARLHPFSADRGQNCAPLPLAGRLRRSRARNCAPPRCADRRRPPGRVKQRPGDRDLHERRRADRGFAKDLASLWAHVYARHYDRRGFGLIN